MLIHPINPRFFAPTTNVHIALKAPILPHPQTRYKLIPLARAPPFACKNRAPRFFRAWNSAARENYIRVDSITYTPTRAQHGFNTEGLLSRPRCIMRFSTFCLWKFDNAGSSSSVETFSPSFFFFVTPPGARIKFPRVEYKCVRELFFHCFASILSVYFNNSRSVRSKFPNKLPTRRNSLRDGGELGRRVSYRLSLSPIRGIGHLITGPRKTCAR